jgi:hypothetical protein
MGKQAYRGESQLKCLLKQATLLPEKKNKVVMRFEVLTANLLIIQSSGMWWCVTGCFPVYRITVPSSSELSSQRRMSEPSSWRDYDLSKYQELLTQWHSINWIAIFWLLWHWASKTPSAVIIWYRPYVSKYKKWIFSYSILWKTEDDVKNAHKAAHVQYRYLPENLRFCRVKLYSGIHYKYRYQLQDRQRQQVPPKHQYLSTTLQASC